MSDKDNYHSPFPRRLRLLFDETRTSQAVLAEYIGVSRQAISQWSNGNTTPDCFNFKKLAEYFNVPLEYLYGETDSRIQANIRLADELALSDEAIATIIAMKDAPHFDPNDSDSPTKCEILSDIIASTKFGEMMEYIQRAIIEYQNHECAADRDVGTIPDVLGVEYEERKNLSAYGKAVMDADKMAIFCVYQSVDAFKKIVEGLPENYWRKTVGLEQ